MPNYIYNVVYRGKQSGTLWKREPQSFPGPARDFAREKLLTWMADNSDNANHIVVVNVWDSDREGAGVPAKRICQLSNHQLDEGPFDPDQIYIDYGVYYIFSLGYDFFHFDPVLKPGGTASFSGTPYGLIAPGEGPAVQIKAGHDAGWIALQVARRDAEPAPDLEAWEAVEQVVIQPAGELLIADLMGNVADHYPDLRGGHDSGYLAIRVSVRGRDKHGIPASPLNPRRTPLEDHLIETWPVAGPAPHIVLKRDEFSRSWENPPTSVGKGTYFGHDDDLGENPAGSGYSHG